MGWLDTFKDWVFGEEKEPPALNRTTTAGNGWKFLPTVGQRPGGGGGSDNYRELDRNGTNGGRSYGGPAVYRAPQETGPSYSRGGGGASWGGPLPDTTAKPWRDTRPLYEDGSGTREDKRSREQRSPWGLPNLDKY